MSQQVAGAASVLRKPEKTIPHALKRAEELSALRKQRRPNLIDEHVGSRVRLRRLMLGWSQSKLGEALGVSFQQIQKYEKGINRIGAGRLQNVAEILEVPVTYFFEGLQKSEGLDNYSDYVLTSEGLSLAEAFMRIDDRGIRRRIINLIEQIGDCLEARN